MNAKNKPRRALRVGPIPEALSVGSTQKEDNDPGSHLFPIRHSNTALFARKNTGKTVCLFHALSQCLTPGTIVYVFCPTHEIDPAWIAIKEMMKTRQVDHKFFDDFIERDVRGGRSILPDLAEVMKSRVRAHKDAIKAATQTSTRAQNRIPRGGTMDDIMKMPLPGLGPVIAAPDPVGPISPMAPVAVRRGRLPKAPQHIVVFDDISESLKHASFGHFLRKNRHYHAKTLTSTQWPNDVAPAAWKQLDYALLFSAMPDDKLEQIHRKICMPIDFPIFQAMYRRATREPHSFLYVDTRKDKYRETFEYQIN